MAHGDPFARLTAAQHEAVFSEEPRLAVHAAAGAGKTRVLTLRVARMVEEGIDPSQLLVVTFSRKAAQELRRRLWQLGVEGVHPHFGRKIVDRMAESRAAAARAPTTMAATVNRSALAGSWEWPEA